MTEAADSASEIVRARAGQEPIEYAFVLGAGLGSVFEGAENEVSIPYAELPGFPQLPSSAHEGRLAIGTQDGVRVAYMLGRSHYYETGDPRCMAAPLETLALLGARQIVLTGSAGSAKADLYPGAIAILADHINLCGVNPLIGIASDGGSISLTETYDPRFTRRLKRSTVRAGVTIHEGVYMWFSGPSFETPAEVKMARVVGADLIGMSIVPEAILARRLGLRVAALAVVTHFGAGFS
ncbi:MAG TPA: purine-nucleoside phosphorylase, partial [Beijerinckiaceae bacterium]|nr:purine-nucleoside phosphorylase [Beijerinckiaceae bacterium]